MYRWFVKSGAKWLVGHPNLARRTDVTSQDNGWPDLPKFEQEDRLAALQKEIFMAELEVAKQRQLADIEVAKQQQLAHKEADPNQIDDLVKADNDHENALDQAIQDAYIEVAKGDLERRTGRADLVQKAAAAIGSAYTGILALSFSLDKQQLLPAQGIVPTIFLGLAVCFSTAYIAFLRKPSPRNEGAYTSTGIVPLDQVLRRNAFVNWATAGSWQRVYLLDASILCLGAGVIFLPSAYLALHGWIEIAFWVFVAICVVSIFFVIFYLHQTDSLSSAGKQGTPPRNTGQVEVNK